MELLEEYDVVVIGGGAAGLSGATALARQLRSVLVIGHGDPRNGPSAGVHAFLSRDGISPFELLAIGRDEFTFYGGHLLNAEVTSVTGSVGAFMVATSERASERDSVRARRVLVTTGLTDELPAIPGMRELWGRDVVHCPYCHGYEVRGQAIGVLATQPMALHQAGMFRQLSHDVTLFLNDTLTLDASQAELLAARGITVVSGAVESLDVVDDRLAAVVLADGRSIPRTTLVLGARVSANSAVLTSLGLSAVEHELGFGTFVPADANGLTAVPGVWVAGNLANPMLQVGGVATAGVWSGSMINADLIAEETATALATFRAAA